MRTNRRTYDVVIQDKPARNSIWLNPPPSTLYLQRGLMATRDPQFLVGVELLKHAEGIDHYMTPETDNDGLWWRNGLDGKRWLHEAFAVFPSLDAAKAAVGRHAKRGLRCATIYRAVISPKAAQIRLVPVAHGLC